MTVDPDLPAGPAADGPDVVPSPLSGPPRRRDGADRRGAIAAIAIVVIVAAIALVVVVVIGAGAAQEPGPVAVRPTPTLPGAGTRLPTPIPTRPVTVPPSTPAATPTARPATPPPTPTATPTPTPPARSTVATRIRIERLGIDLPIVPGDGLDAPIGKAAHYPGSGWPGGGTNIFIYGHAREGMFITLWKAKVGDVVTLDLADGGERSYVVTKVLPKVPWNATSYLAPTPTEILTLQTSTSYYASAPRFIVIAEPAS